jgi:tripartite ATP-independent transporter DctM subunit
MNIFILMLVFLFILLLLKVPIGFSLLGTSIMVLISARGFGDIPYSMIAQRMLYGVNNFTLLAIPTFILIGKLMNDSGITDRIFNVARAYFGHLKGGLGYVNIVASIIFAGMSGSAVADAGGLGAVEIKAMKDDGYPEGFSAAVTGASSTIGPIIPPSIPAVIYGALAQTSISTLFIASILPGFLMGVGMMIVIYIISVRNNYPTSKRASFREILTFSKEGFLPMLTPLIIIGGILTGVFTPTEAAAIALFYSIFISFVVYKSINLKRFWVLLVESLKDTAVLLFIIAASNVFSWVIGRYQVTHGFVEMLTNTITNPFLILLLLNIFLLIIGCFIDAVPALFLLTPVLMPLIAQYGIDPIHFGVIMILNLMIGLITPPVGTVLFTLNKITTVPFKDLMRNIIPFYIPLIIVLVLVTYVPSLVMFIPNLLM